MLASLLIVMLPRPYAKWICAFAGGIATVASVGLAATFAGNGMNAVDVTWASMGQTLVMGFIFDRMSTLLAPAFVAIGLLVVIYSIPYMSENNREHPDAPRRRFYAYLATFIGAMAGLVYSSTIFGQLVFFEITGACSWGLISYYMTPTAKKAGMKALIITHIGALGSISGRRLRVRRNRHVRAYRDLPASTPGSRLSSFCSSCSRPGPSPPSSPSTCGCLPPWRPRRPFPPTSMARRW